jgi:hypothetical protein
MGRPCTCCCGRTFWAIDRATGEVLWKRFPRFNGFGAHIESDLAGGIIISGVHQQCDGFAADADERYTVARYDADGVLIWKVAVSDAAVLNSKARAAINPSDGGQVLCWHAVDAPELEVRSLADGSLIERVTNAPGGADMTTGYWTKTRIIPTTGSNRYDLVGGSASAHGLDSSVSELNYIGDSRGTAYLPSLARANSFQGYPTFVIHDDAMTAIPASGAVTSGPNSDCSDWCVSLSRCRAADDSLVAVTVQSRTAPSEAANDDCATIFYDLATGVEDSRYSRIASPIWTPGVSGLLSYSDRVNLCDGATKDVLEWGEPGPTTLPRLMYWAGDGSLAWSGEFQTRAGSGQVPYNALFLSADVLIVSTPASARLLLD